MLASILTHDNDTSSPAWPNSVHCPHGDECGACAFLETDYASQLRHKEQMLAHAMEKQRGSIGDKLLPCLPSPKIAFYRNRVRMAVGISKRREVRLGYFRAASREIVDAPDCRVLLPELLETTRSLRHLLERKTSLFPHQLRHIDVRCGSDPRRQHLILVLRHEQMRRLPVDAIRKACRYVDGMSVNLNPSKGPYVIKGRIDPLWGRREVYVESGDLRLRVSPGSFFQVNLAQLPEIHSLMRDFLGEGQCLADLYAGVGTHGLALHDSFRKVVFVEGVRAAIADTKATLEHHVIDNAEVVAKPVERSAKQILEAAPDAVVMNPSRAGATRDVLDTLIASPTRRLAYLSCDPETLARDLDYLANHRFELVSLQPIDMMPQTRQVEALALVSRRRS